MRLSVASNALFAAMMVTKYASALRTVVPYKSSNAISGQRRFAAFQNGIVPHTFTGNKHSSRNNQAFFRLFSSKTNDDTDTPTITKDEEEAIYWSTEKVRSEFISYFENTQGHTYQPSSAVAPLNDPTLLFTNAGMNQFKPIFLGQADPNSKLATLKKAVNSQKCIRAGGKHNDLEDVGRDTYHHTFFEMLGSWSFGDYFKKEAIDYAWDLLVNVYGIDPDRLYATYFEGDESMGLDVDLEAKEFWLKYLPEERVIASNSADNFWEMGETGPCGPCTEIHYDRIGNRDAAFLVNADDPDVIEIWNIVFIQYNRDNASTLSPLPMKHIDTGMGLERLVSLLQDKSSNYDIDVFQPLFNKIAEHSKVGEYGGLVLEEDTTLRDTAYRAIADHARTLCFAIADGAVPNNEGRGYVLRRVLRRATRYGKQILKAEPGFFSTLVPVVVDTFGKAFPELIQNQETILEIIQEEEQAFSTMLDRGIKFFSELQSELMAKEDASSRIITGEKAFYLYDTLGFPIDLTELMAEEAGISVDTDGFFNAMETQKQRSRDARNAAKAGGEGQVRLELIAEQTAWLTDNGVDVTNDDIKFEWDVEPESTIQAIFSVDGFLTGDDEEAGVDDYVGLIMDSSPFYAEAGGQEADLGVISIEDENGEVAEFQVTDVQSYGGFSLHTGKVKKGTFKVGSKVKSKVDYDRRREVAPNHTMTHVLNAALREVLGDGVEQRGSLCNDEKLRFDFSHKKAMSLKQLRRTEDFVREKINNEEVVSSKVMPLEDAKAIDGVRAVFGEVYPDPVRVVSVGDDTSVEFCGGTHIGNTAEAEAFAIVEETAVAKGIRRITAVTKGLASQAIQEGTKFDAIVTSVEQEANEGKDLTQLDKKAGSLRKDLDDGYMPAPLKAELRARIEAIQKKGIAAKKAALAGRVDRVLNVVSEQIKSAMEEGVKMIVLNVDIAADSKASQKVMKAAQKLAPDVAFMGISEEEPGSGGKVMCFALVPDKLVEEGFKADEWVRSTLAVCGGRGGGKPGSAQGQAKECVDVEAVLAEGNAFAEKIMS